MILLILSFDRNRILFADLEYVSVFGGCLGRYCTMSCSRRGLRLWVIASMLRRWRLSSGVAESVCIISDDAGVLQFDL